MCHMVVVGTVDGVNHEWMEKVTGMINTTAQYPDNAGIGQRPEAMAILDRDKSGHAIHCSDPEYHVIAAIIEQARKITARMNTGYHEDHEIRTMFAGLTGVDVDPTFVLRPPFYTDFGRNIRVGKQVFINTCCTFMDRGGITIGDGALIGPKVNLVTTGHLEDPDQRRATVSRPIVIGNNVWLGVAAGVMPGVTIGRGSIVAAHAVVTKDVPENVIVAGIPARVIRKISAKNIG